MICWNRSCQLTGMRYLRTSQLRRLGLPLERGEQGIKGDSCTEEGSEISTEDQTSLGGWKKAWTTS